MEHSGIDLIKSDWERQDEEGTHTDIDDYVPVASVLQEENQKMKDWRNWFIRSHEEAMRIPLWDDNWAQK